MKSLSPAAISMLAVPTMLGVAVDNLSRNATFGVRPVFQLEKPLRPDGGVTA